MCSCSSSIAGARVNDKNDQCTSRSVVLKLKQQDRIFLLLNDPICSQNAVNDIDGFTN